MAFKSGRFAAAMLFPCRLSYKDFTAFETCEVAGNTGCPDYAQGLCGAAP